MGLDITAYNKVELIKAGAYEALEDILEGDEGLEYIYVNPHFKTQQDDLVNGAYRVDCGYDFRAGSYSGYNRWRAMLAEMVGTTDDAVFARPKEGPFVEMINFSDCEGVIGPRTCAKLAKDFSEWQDRAATFASSQGEQGEWWLKKYKDWAEAYALAAGRGAVRFTSHARPRPHLLVQGLPHQQVPPLASRDQLRLRELRPHRRGPLRRHLRMGPPREFPLQSPARAPQGAQGHANRDDLRCRGLVRGASSLRSA